MLINNLNDEEIEYYPGSDEESPEGFLAAIDVTFPFAWGEECPANFMCVDSPDADELKNQLGRLNSTLDETAAYLHAGGKLSPNFRKAETILASLIVAVTEDVEVDEGDDARPLVRDSYNGLRAFTEYLNEVFAPSQSYRTHTRGEDDDGAPGMSSAYIVHWDDDPTAAVARACAVVREHVSRIEAGEYKSVNP